MNTIRAIHAFGGNIAIIGGILIADVETVANTAVHKSDSVHLLHKSGSGDKSRSPLYCLNSLKTLHLKLVAQVHSSPKKSIQVQGVGVKMVGCPVRLYGIEVLSEENKMLDFQ